MNDQPPTGKSRSNVKAWVFILAFMLTAAGIALMATAPRINPATLPIHIPVVVLFGFFLVAATAPFNLEVGRNGFALSLTEIPIVLGLLSTGRTLLVVAASLGFLVSKIYDRRVARIKLVFNVPLCFAEIAAAIAVFDRFAARPSPSSPTTWIELVLALTAATALSTTAVNIVILSAGDELTVSQAIRHTLLGMVNATMALGLTITGMILLRVTPAAVVLLALLATLVIAPMRRYATLQRRFASLQSLHDFTASLTRSKDLRHTLESAASQCARILRAESAEIVICRVHTPTHRTGTPSSDHRAPEPGDEVWTSVLTHAKSVRYTKGSKHGGDYLARHGYKDLMAVPLRHDDDVIGMLVVCDRQGDVSTFDDNDLAILLTMADQTTITLQNLRLIDRLRDEATTREHQAMHDDLTGLPNRASLAATIQNGIDQSDGIRKFSVLLIDLNRFKDVNDTLGHHAGDRVLVEVAKRLQAALPKGASAARLGGDEFAITLSSVRDVDHACWTAHMIQQTFAEPIDIDGMTLRVDASVGVSVFPDHGLDGSTLMQRADVAMYAAKAEKGAAIRRYDPSQEQSTMRHLTLIADLRGAVENGLLDVHFQPKASLRTGQLVGVEALARWKHPTFGPVGPDEFIPLAEQAGFITELTDLVLRSSLAVCASWRHRGIDLSVAVNLDAATLARPEFVARIEALLHQYAVPAHLLTFEITEREIVREIELAATRMNELREVGVRFSIDDFGTGYSSLGYLARLPVDEVKIDRSFAGDVADSRRHTAIVRAVTDIAGSLGLTTVAEGVEDQRCWDALQTLGCDVAQGWHLARAMTADDLSEWYQAYENERRVVVGGAAG